MMTLQELKQILQDRLNPEDILERFDITSEDLLDRFEERIEIQFKDLLNEFAEEENTDDNNYRNSGNDDK
jgi:hypothetical protein